MTHRNQEELGVGQNRKEQELEQVNRGHHIFTACMYFCVELNDLYLLIYYMRKDVNNVKISRFF